MPLPKSSRLSSLILIALSCIAYLGQELVLHNNWLRSKVPQLTYKIFGFGEKELGIFVLILAALGFGALCPKLQHWWNHKAIDPALAAESPGPAKGRYGSILTWLALFASLGFTVSSQYSYLQVGETLATQSLWLLGLSSFAVCLAIGFIRENHSHYWKPSPEFTYVHWALLGCIVIAGFWLRFWDVGEIPRKVNYDVAGTGLFARRNLSSSGWNVFGLGDYGVAHLSFATNALVMRIFGDNLFGLRMTSVILGTLMIPASYFVAWRSFDCHRVAAITAAVIASNSPHIQFSRHIMNIDPWGIFTVGLFFIAHGLRSYAAWALGAAGMCVALAVHFYLSGRVLCFALPLFFLLILRDRSTRRFPLWKGMVYFAIGVFVVFGPNIIDIWINSVAWKESNRPWSTFLLTKNLCDYSNVNQFTTIPQLIVSRLWTILLLPYINDTSGQSTISFPFFNSSITPLFWLGLGVCLFEMKRNPVQLLLLIIVTLTVVMGIAIAPVNAYWPKLLSFTIIGPLFIARSGSALISSCVSLFVTTSSSHRENPSKLHSLANIILQVAIVIIFGVLGVQNWNTYRAAAAKDSFDASVLAWYVAGLPEGMKVCGVHDPTQHVNLNELPVLFLANKQDRRAFTDKNPDAMIAECGAPPFVWIVTHDQEALKDSLLRTFPNGKLEEQYWPGGGGLFRSYSVAH
jgi:hypothetical protein